MQAQQEHSKGFNVSSSTQKDGVEADGREGKQERRDKQRNETDMLWNVGVAVMEVSGFA